jgi:pyrimidine-nucleoside phosphorylase
MAIAGQTADLAPADKKLYALRDVTGTVDQMSLIASSIMSKKLASGADAIVLDVKTGDGAFMKTIEDATALAEEMVSIGKLAEKKMAAIISDMDQPLGFAVGNALEVKEAIETLHGNGPKDLEELVLTLGSYMVYMAEKATSIDEARELLYETLQNGSAFETFCKFIEAQGGNKEEALQPDLLPKARYIESVYATEDCFVSKIHTEEIGKISLLLGGGRETKESEIDLAVGVLLSKKHGDFVKKGEPIAEIHANDIQKLQHAKERLLKAYEFTSSKVEKQPFIKNVIV